MPWGPRAPSPDHPGVFLLFGPQPLAALPASPSPPGRGQPRAADQLPPVAHATGLFLREARPQPPTANWPLQRSEPFVVFQTKELPVLNVSLGPFSTSQVVARELLQPSSSTWTSPSA